jgi:MFS family permease
VPIGILGLILVLLYLPDYREEEHKRFDIAGFILFGSGIAILSYVLEIFGERILTAGETLTLLAVSLGLLAAYGVHSLRTSSPLLDLSLFHIRTFSVSVMGSFFSRLGVGGVPFLLPLLYQLTLGFTPMQSGLLIMPQAIAGIIAKLALPRLLDQLGYRNLLMANTILMGLLLMLFATVGPGTPVWLIVAQASCYGACTSLQYTTMNTMAYADIPEHKLSNATSIASTAQELSISFGIAAAGLITAMLIPDHVLAESSNMMRVGIHQAFLVLGGLTMLSTLIFSKLKDEDGANVIQRKQIQTRRRLVFALG